MLVSVTTPDRTITRTIAMARVAFRVGNLVGVQDVSLSRLNGQPARSPNDASPCPSRDTTHGSGPVWVATAFTVEDFHLLLFAGLPAHYQLSLTKALIGCLYEPVPRRVSFTQIGG